MGIMQMPAIIKMLSNQGEVLDFTIESPVRDVTPPGASARVVEPAGIRIFTITARTL